MDTGNFFGEQALFNKCKRMASIVAKSKRVVCLTIDRFNLLSILGDHVDTILIQNRLIISLQRSFYFKKLTY
jgi:CRP-like cAMP-binding protein